MNNYFAVGVIAITLGITTLAAAEISSQEAAGALIA